MKKCSSCNISKTLDSFGKDNRIKCGLKASCKDCVSMKAKKNYLKNKYKRIEYIKNWTKNNPDKVKRTRKKWHSKESNKLKTFDYHLRRTYGINLEKYNSLLIEQNYCCKICNLNVNELKSRLAVDHNHETEKIRGLLCTNCNQGLGSFKADIGIELLEKAVRYIVNTRKVA
jgi:hypothetical protein